MTLSVSPVPATSPSTPGCTPTTGLLRFDGGYEVSMCYRTPDGVDGQAKAGLYASAESGLLWFFSRENAEVLVKVLNGCAINGHRWVFTAPVTTLEFDLWVTSPTGERWTHGNTQGVTAATKSDVAAFECADEPDAAPDPIVSGVSVSDSTIDASDDFIASDAVVGAPMLAVDPQTEATPDTPNSDVPLSSSTTPGCTPTTGLLHFDGGYEVSMCYRTPDGVDGQAKAGLYASAESGLLWFFSRDNAEVLVKVLNGCAINGHRWIFVAPVTTLEFDLRVTSPTGAQWTHSNTQGETAATKSDVAAFACADEPDAAPDLIVSDVTVSDANPVVNQIIKLRATVLNRGDDPATPTTLRYYSSTDSTISTSNDDLLASDAVPALSASATESRTLDFRTPSTPGTLYLGACIKPFSAESNTGNNCSAGVRVVVEDEPEAAPDLIVSGVSASDATPGAGQTITLRAAVRNRGDGPATPTTLHFYRSSDSTISTSDGLLASTAVPALSASATESRTVDFRTPSTPGTFYVGACIDSVAGESDTSNNCSAGVRVVVEDEPEAAPDLTVSSVSVSDATPSVGQTVTVRATVRNRGDGPATPTTLRFYRSSDSTISTSDGLLASAAVPALSASATESRTVDFRAPSVPGTFYVGACIDPVSAESDTGNNCSTGVLVTVRKQPAPDLTVSDVSVSNANVIPGESFLFFGTVLNDGDGPASATLTRFYRSNDPTISPEDDKFPEDAPLPALAASATQFVQFVGSASSTPETFYVGICITPVAGESNTDNNCSVGVRVDVEDAPDLVPDVSVSDENPDPEQTIELRATVRNRGSVSASPTTLRFYRSDDSTISSTDDEIGNAAVAVLAVSATQSLKLDFTVPSTAGVFYLGACIDAVSGENNTDNNCSSVRVGEPEGAPDLIVSDPSVSNENPDPEQTIEFRATVQNLGDAPASPTRMIFYQSNDPTINSADRPLGHEAVAALAASATESKTFDHDFSTPSTWYLGACVGAVSGESDRNNNCSTSVRVVVKAPGPAPDLTVSEFTVSDTNPGVSEDYVISATVRNVGDDSASRTRIRYYQSADSQIDVGDTQFFNQGVAALAASAEESKTLEATAITPSTFYLGACIDVVSGESDRNNNCSTSVLVQVE